MGKGTLPKNQNPPPDALSDSSDVEDSSNVDEVPTQEGTYSTQRPGSRVELELEDSVTCQWEDCGVVFTHLPTLIEHIHNDHIGVHKSNYTCEWASCLRRGLPQTSRFALISHIRSHTGEKPFICPLAECDKSFTRSDALAKHMRLQHNLTPPAPGRGGARKRKRGVEEGFNTFKVDSNAIAEHPDDQPAEKEQLTSVSSRTKGSLNTKGKKQTRQAQLQTQSQHTPSPDIQQQEDEDGYTSSASDVLPPSLMVHYDESTGLVMGKPKAEVMYLLMKAKHQYAMEQNESLSVELRDLRAELESEKSEKEIALDELLHRMLGPEATFFMPVSVSMPPEITLDDVPQEISAIDSAATFDQHPSAPIRNGSHS